MFDLATAKTRLGITGTAQDAEVQAAINAALEAVEMYLNRKLTYNNDKEIFRDVRAHAVSLRRYPVESITTVSQDYFQVDTETGLLYFDGYGVGRAITVEYIGGFKVIPAAIETALWMTLDNFWLVFAGGSVSSGGIKTVKAGDLSITYDNAVGASVGDSMIPGAAAALLLAYRRELV